METNRNNFCSNSAPRFYCNFCDYGTSKKSSYDDHLLSMKHKKATNGNKVSIHKSDHSAQLCSITSNVLSCVNCNRAFKSRSGLWKHNKICVSHKLETKNPIINIQVFTDINKFIEVMKNEIS